METAASKSFRELTESELNQLAEHQRWLDSQGAEGNRANFEGHGFRYSNLQERNLRQANLIGANLKGANRTEAVLIGATLRKADLRETVLRDADLANVTGLLPVQLAGADLSGALQPDNLKEFEALRQVEYAAEYCHKLLVAALAARAYC
jgi:uncharacterized protein YjbI with pentapeptide repeats